MISKEWVPYIFVFRLNQSVCVPAQNQFEPAGSELLPISSGQIPHKFSKESAPENVPAQLRTWFFCGSYLQVSRHADKSFQI